MRAILVASSVARHSVGMLAQAFLVAAIIAALVFGAATLAGVAPSGAGLVFAAKGGNGDGGLGGSGGAGSSVWIMELSGAGLAAASPLQYGNAFTVGYSTKDREPWAFAQCIANSTTVLSGNPYADGSIWGEYFSVYPGGPLPQAFVLGESVAPIWLSGGADCTVSLLKFTADYARQTVLATTTFSVAP